MNSLSNTGRGDFQRRRGVLHGPLAQDTKAASADRWLELHRVLPGMVPGAGIPVSEKTAPSIPVPNPRLDRSMSQIDHFTGSPCKQSLQMRSEIFNIVIVFQFHNWQH